MLLYADKFLIRNALAEKNRQMIKNISLTTQNISFVRILFLLLTYIQSDSFHSLSHIHVYIHTHTYIYIYMYTYTHKCVCVCVCVYIYIYKKVGDFSREWPGGSFFNSYYTEV